MGHKHSKHRSRLRSRPECTEIVEIESSVAEIKHEQEKCEIEYPEKLNKIIDAVEKIKGDIKSMSQDDLVLYFATMKDELHNNWRYTYELNFENSLLMEKKNEIIDDIKKHIDYLNRKVLNRSCVEL
ncbi:unnamed protein product [Brassicogethes aeneus]|uniref:Uncharacterized protein n=1 Tax=Brassicogethes aeneus TaxID=1431903 RepID=A0A9P0BH38_BRAAE|nr:unnamed protein product [Brassicogethes aeneus]